MGSTVFPAAGGGKTMFRTTLTSGTSYTVPAGVTYLNVTLIGGGGSSGSGPDVAGVFGTAGYGGMVVSSTLSATPGASIGYAIGAGGTPPTSNNTTGASGGDTTFTGATTATGGRGGAGNNGRVAAQGSPFLAANGGPSGSVSGNQGTGGSQGAIYVEYWA